MNGNQPMKNYYTILGIPESSSLFQIESAYEKLAAKWHPDKNKEHRKSAEAKFQEIAEAYEVLSDRNKRSHYDELLTKQYSLDDANKTFSRFFNEHGIVDEIEEKFFNENFPHPLASAYNVLGVTRTSTMTEIRDAYRKLAMKWHPKTNPGNAEANAKFIEVNQAYNAICNEEKKENYDNLLFGQMVPMKAHNIFDDFFGMRMPMMLDEDFKPMFQTRWVRDIDRMMMDENDMNMKDMKEGQTIKTSSVWSSKNGQESGKTVTMKKMMKDGKMKEETTEDYLFPSGERKIVKKIKADGKCDCKEYKLKKGEAMPKELMN